MPFSPDPEQAQVLEHGAGPLLVRGSAGTGKTTALRERFVRLLEHGADPERVALVVRSRRDRIIARAQVLERLSASLPDLRVLTAHGLAFHVISERFRALGYQAPPTVLSAQDQFARVHELLVGEDASEWPAYGEMLRLRGFADEVRQFLLRAQEALRRPEDIEERAKQRDLSGWIELAAFYRRYLQNLDAGLEVDFAGLVEQAASAAQGSEPMFDHLLVDDYQDTTLGTEALLLALRPSSLVVAGNPEAHVFSFQGSTDEPLRQFADRFAGSSEVALRTPHRTEGATFTAWHAAHTSEEHASVARELRRLHVEERVAWNDLAVVVRRHGEQVGGLLRALDDAGIPRVVPEGGGSLLVEPATAPYVLALRWLARRDERDGLTESLLTSDLSRLSPAEARGLVRAAKLGGGSAADALSLAGGLAGEPAEAVADLHDVLDRAERVAGRSVLDAFRVLWQELPSSALLVAESETGSVESRRELDGVLGLARAVSRAGESADPSTEAFLSSLEAGEEGPGLAAEAEGEGAVPVLTAHGSAGREFDTVLVVGAMEGNFPSLSRPEPMFDLATLDSRVSQSERNRLRLEDERRLFGLVTSRARRRTLFAASDERDAEDLVTTRSRFVAELGVEWGPAPAGPFPDPITVAEANATWRRTLADHRAPASLRLSATAGLLALGGDPATWWFQRDWTDTGEPLRGGTIRVSASRLDTLDNCELQFVLGEELGLDTSTGYQAWVGHTVHRIIEDCEKGVLPRDLDALIRAAEERWRPDQFPSNAVSETFRGLVTDRMLPAWFEEFGAEPALKAEERFEFEFDGATVTGVIDRIGEAQPEGSQIIDYKTGKRKWGDADQVLQLGVYYLAVHEAENLKPYLPVRAIELAFVRDVDRYQGGIARQAMAFTSADEPEYEARMRETLSELIGRVRDLYETESIRPNPGANCRFCRFQSLCPLFPEGAPLFPVHEDPRKARV